MGGLWVGFVVVVVGGVIGILIVWLFDFLIEVGFIKGGVFGSGFLIFVFNGVLFCGLGVVDGLSKDDLDMCWLVVVFVGKVDCVVWDLCVVWWVLGDLIWFFG